MADNEGTLTAIVATFGSTQEAEQWLKHAHDQGYKVAEGIVVRKDDNGKVHEHLANLPGIAAGAGVGAVLGAVIAVIFPPAAIAEALAVALGLGAAGAVVGAGGVAIKDELMDRQSFRDVGEQLEPGQSAMVVIMPTETAAVFEGELAGFVNKTSQELPNV